MVASEVVQGRGVYQPQAWAARALRVRMDLGEQLVHLAYRIECNRPEQPHLPFSREGYSGMTVCHALLLLIERMFSAEPDIGAPTRESRRCPAEGSGRREGIADGRIVGVACASSAASLRRRSLAAERRYGIDRSGAASRDEARKDRAPGEGRT
jgi:hypothetical protein